MASTTHLVDRNVHIVLFKYKQGVADDDKNSVAQQFEALARSCVSPDTGKPYIASIDAGTNYSEEGKDKGYDHGFVVTFHNEADRQYYLNTDPAHQAFKESSKPHLEDVLVFDLVPGMF
ncbi:hypothetical protein FRB99_008299 [Tulasnella sp. 403]|nr:hypothetical protein FRB99_008299 [Tulasnella sp. 403]